MVRMEIRKNIISVFFPVSVFLLYLMFLMGDGGDILPDGGRVSVLGAIWNKLQGNWQHTADSCCLAHMNLWRGNGYLPVLMPVICGLPCAMNYMEEVATGNKKLVLARCPVKKYYMSKITGNILSAVLTVLGAAVLYYITLLVFFDGTAFTDAEFPMVYFRFTGILPDGPGGISAALFAWWFVKKILYFILYAVMGASFFLTVAAFCLDKYIAAGAAITLSYVQMRIYQGLADMYVREGNEAAGTAASIINPQFLGSAGQGNGFYGSREIPAVLAALLVIAASSLVMVQFTGKQFDASER